MNDERTAIERLRNRRLRVVAAAMALIAVAVLVAIGAWRAADMRRAACEIEQRGFVEWSLSEHRPSVHWSSAFHRGYEIDDVDISMPDCDEGERAAARARLALRRLRGWTP